MTEDLDALANAYLGDVRAHGDGAPWVLLNMIASLDGAVTLDGLSGGLGNEADFAVFKTLRSLADVILVAAGTARAEEYRVPSPTDEEAERRRSRGQSDRPTIAVVTRSLDLDLGSSLFSHDTYRPVVVTVADAPARKRAEVGEVADVVVAGEADVDLVWAVAELSDRHGHVVLAEGGPTLNAQLAAEDVLDELCITTAPLLVGGASSRIVAGGHHHEPRDFRVDRALTARGLLFTRYLRDR